ncbi:hypothetical protein Pla175_38100 [Pirellulimonas nuda]|uniref:Uncharacterized protein n=1 Tax=Pirellulimonas nuda TaxID=2528009 RepID=A0A518DG05_9BACT|nr:hypothetical protein Pla175_38100 [Pirellulimonas nuda]
MTPIKAHVSRGLSPINTASFAAHTLRETLVWQNPRRQETGVWLNVRKLSEKNATAKWSASIDGLLRDSARSSRPSKLTMSKTA